MKDEKVDLYMQIGFIGFVSMCILYYLYRTVFTNFDSILSLAKLMTNLSNVMASVINIFFIIFTSLIVGIFFHYILFELRGSYFYQEGAKKKIEKPLREVLKTENKELLHDVKVMLEGDQTFFASLIRRLSIDHFSSRDTLMGFFRSIMDDEFTRVRRNLMYFNLTSVIAPAFGFLGTAIGMVACFYEISIKQFVTPGDLAQSIQLALITTVLGLIIKVIAMLFQTVIVRMIDRRESFIDEKFSNIFTTIDVD